MVFWALLSQVIFFWVWAVRIVMSILDDHFPDPKWSKQRMGQQGEGGASTNHIRECNKSPGCLGYRGVYTILPKYVEIIVHGHYNNDFHPRQKQTASIKKTKEQLKNALQHAIKLHRCEFIVGWAGDVLSGFPSLWDESVGGGLFPSRCCMDFWLYLEAGRGLWNFD